MKLLKSWVVLVLCVCLCAVPAYADFDYDATDSVYAETYISDQSMSYLNNVYLALSQMESIELGFGEHFSFNELVGECSRENGYRIARNGRGARVRGGGVSQVATTLNLAVQDFTWLAIDDFEVYGSRFVGDYVDDGELAVWTDYANEYDYGFTNWYPGTVTIDMWIEDDMICCELNGYAEKSYEPEEVEEVLAVGYTTIPDSKSQRSNIMLASDTIDGTVLEYGEVFSFNNIVGPRTADAGYVKALNGRGVKVMGGGVAQVASTIYLAAKQVDSITMGRIKTYGDRFTAGYVDDPDDAIVTDYSAGTDFSFTYYGSGMLQVNLFELDGDLCCELSESYDSYETYD